MWLSKNWKLDGSALARTVGHLGHLSSSGGVRLPSRHVFGNDRGARLQRLRSFATLTAVMRRGGGEGRRRRVSRSMPTEPEVLLLLNSFPFHVLVFDFRCVFLARAVPASLLPKCLSRSSVDVDFREMNNCSGNYSARLRSRTKQPVYTSDKRAKFTQRENKKWVRLFLSPTLFYYYVRFCFYFPLSLPTGMKPGSKLNSYLGQYYHGQST